ncbi:MAG: DUF4342 domain-containing protein [Oscillospiraceae bacterium]|nr:DUF4342 domain-containing protein [Oscillospiraceae bacterium]
MANIEMVEKLRERANVSYEEASSALDACGGDLLEALIMLEKQGKVSSPAGGSYSSKDIPPETQLINIPQPSQKKGDTFGDMLNKFFKWCGNIIHKGNTNYFEVWRDRGKVLTVPVTVLVLLLIFAFWVTLPLIVIGLFFGCRYYFKGSELENISVNSVMDSAADAATHLKNEVKNAASNFEDKK